MVHFVCIKVWLEVGKNIYVSIRSGPVILHLELSRGKESQMQAEF